MDGGFLYWVPGMADGSYGSPMQDGNPLGLIYTLNFSVPFNSSTNVSSILKTISKAPNGGAANNFAPNYYDGAMLANNDEFFLFGGLLRDTASYSPPDDDEVLAYQAYQYGLTKDGFLPGFVNDKLPDGMTRYVTYGGAANAPSENKAWYFGGYRSPSWGPIFQPTANDSVNPSNVSNTFITLDLSIQQQEKWSNVTLPENIPSRANPSVVWVPVGSQGILVVLGGVSYPEYNNVNATSENEAQSEHDSPSYMANVDIYDIAGGKWYQQPTIAGPPQLAMGCAVVASAQDFSSYNIYYYGGFDGLHGEQDFNDDVWILSLPSFMWMKVSSGKPEHARAGHQCIMPYPDQMVTVGGFRAPNGESMPCLDGGILQVFNLTEGNWLDSYDPDSWNMYGVPEMIHLMIGGNYSGGATMTTPTPSGWATQELASVFATTYPAAKITTFYPYSSQGPGNGTRGSWSGSKGGTPSWVAPVLGVVLGLVFVTAIAVAILLYRRRKLWWKKNGGSENTPNEPADRVTRWLGQTNAKTPTVTTDDPSRFGDTESRKYTPMSAEGHYGGMSEIPELDGYDHPVELSGSLITNNTSKHTPLNSPYSSKAHSNVGSPTFHMGSAAHDHTSNISSSQAPVAQPATFEAQSEQRPDSPPLGAPSSSRRAPPNRGAVVSDMSRIGEREALHLRNVSNGTVSSTTNTAGSPPSTPPAAITGFNMGPASPPVSPSPPSATDRHGVADYMSVYQGMSPTMFSDNGPPAGSNPGVGTSNSLRRSIFRENTDDLGETHPQSYGR
ncbi:hypothetical protein F5Y19DRAFT_438726 [Xylariaceae sp. FL1651]|nr:hypothetical protein F5Y19DRAFT_438726 [Xylariaceae sp. FL1651]